jgi:diguanylate cyclase (GGDEF)-like protein/PAS domain S-box-containing protein
MLHDPAERLIVHEAAARCGLEPLDVVDPDAGHLFRSSKSAAAPGDGPGEENRWLPLIVADEQSPLQGWQTVVHSKDLWASAIVLVRDPRQPSMRHYAYESDPGPEAAYAWVLERPLRLESVIVQIQQAVRANRVFLGRYHQVIEDLYRSRTVFDAVQNGIALADAALPDLPLVYVNPAFERMTGYDAAEVYGHNCRFLQGPDTEQPAVAQIREAVRAHKPVEVLLQNYRKDGAMFWNELRLAPILGLEGQVTHFVGIMTDVTARVESTQKLEQLAYFDALTGLPKGPLLAEQMKQALARAKRSRTKLAVLMFDLEDFTHWNDKYGHLAGDQLLRTVGSRLRETARDHETVARLEARSGRGGDEFVVVLEGLEDEVQHLEAIKRFCLNVARPCDVAGDRYTPVVTVGAALFPRDGYTVDMLCNAAYASVEKARQGA